MVRKEEFIKKYLKGSKLETLPRDLIAIPCNCNKKSCEGWQVVHRDTFYRLIVDFIRSGRNHERKKRAICQKFAINRNVFVETLTAMTRGYLIYEAGKGAVGVLVDTWE